MIKVNLYAAAREAVGFSDTKADVETIEELIKLFANDNSQKRRVLDQCSYLVDGVVTHDRQRLLAPASEVDVLPPFAGG